MDWNDGRWRHGWACPTKVAYGLGQRIRGHGVVCLVNVHKHGNSAGALNGGHCRHRCMGDGENRLSRTNTQSAQGELQSVRAVAAADASGAAEPRGKVIFKICHFRAKNILAAVKDARHGFKNFKPPFGKGRVRIGEGDISRHGAILRARMTLSR